MVFWDAMRRFSACLALLLSCGGAWARFIDKPIASYRMDARLDTGARVIHGKETITWYNHSNSSIPDLQFHLYLNAFRNEQSTYMREQRRGGGRDSETGGEKAGWCELDRLVVDGRDLTGAIQFIQPDDQNRDDRTVIRVALPQAVAAHAAVQI